MVNEMTMVLALCWAQGTSSLVSHLAGDGWGIQGEGSGGEQTSLEAGVGTQ